MSKISLPYNWSPRPYQQRLWDYMRQGGTRGLEVGHRRWGKDDLALHFTCVAAHKRVGNYWHMLPEYAQARKAIWDAVNPKTGKRRIDEAFPPQIRAKNGTNSRDMMIKLACGSTWQLVGSDSYNALVGSPPIGVILSEFSISNPLAWAYIRPILLENGGWALFIYTPRGDNHGKRQYDMAKQAMVNDGTWFAEISPATITGVFTPDMLASERLELIAEWGPEEGEALYQQEYMCSFEGVVVGSYYGKVLAEAKLDNRIGHFPYSVGHEVYTFWDIGFDDSMTIWFMQDIRGRLVFIDYYENSRYGLDHYAKVLKEKGYVYGDHYMPHDAASGSPQTGLTFAEYAEGLGIRPVIIADRPRDTVSVIMGIQAGRKIFNHLYFDERKCAQGLAALENYRSDYDPKRKKSKNRPRHDWSSHGSDAFRTFAVSWEPKVRVVSVSSRLEGIQLHGGI